MFTPQVQDRSPARIPAYPSHPAPLPACFSALPRDTDIDDEDRAESEAEVVANSALTRLRLITAAPDLLAELQKAHALLQLAAKATGSAA